MAAYLDIDYIVKICKENGVEAVHPGKCALSNRNLIYCRQDQHVVYTQKWWRTGWREEKGRSFAVFGRYSPVDTAKHADDFRWHMVMEPE